MAKQKLSSRSFASSVPSAERNEQTKISGKPVKDFRLPNGKIIRRVHKTIVASALKNK